MIYSLYWMADILRKAGCQVHDDPVAVGKWKERGHEEFGAPKGVLLHHTACDGHFDKDLPDVAVLIKGRPAPNPLAGPLCNLGLGRSGTFYPIAAGLAYHAGRGAWHDVTNGNYHLIGIEMENSGLPDDPWPAVQLEAARKGVRALLNYIHAPFSMCAGHKEYALPHGRKVDPDFDMDAFRKSLEQSPSTGV